MSDANVVRAALVSAVVTALLLFSVVTTAAAGDATASRIGPSVVATTIESKQNVYAFGQPIFVRITMRNATEKPYHFRSRTPWKLVSLRIINGSGEVVQPTDYLDYHDVMMSVFVPLPVRATSLYGPDGPTDTWLNLSHWGYGALAVGTYTITAVSTAYLRLADEQGELIGYEFQTGQSPENSGSVKITIRR